MNHWPIEELLPHADEMLLLDAVIEAEVERIVSRRVSAGGLFNSVDSSLPAWVSVELMAQSIAAWTGWQAKHEQRPVRLGFLPGTRHYQCDVEAFPAGSELLIEAVRNFQDDHGMAVFTYRIDAPGVHGEARLTVFSPLNADTFLTNSTQGHTDA